MIVGMGEDDHQADYVHDDDLLVDAPMKLLEPGGVSSLPLWAPMLVMLRACLLCYNLYDGGFLHFWRKKKGNISDFCFDKPKACSFPYKHSAPVRFITCFELPCQLHPSGITTTTNMTNCKVKHCAVQALCFPRCIFPIVFALHWNALDKIYPSLHHCVHLLSPVLAGPSLAFTQPLHCYCKMWKWVWSWS